MQRRRGEVSDIKPGSIWSSRDKRDNGRQVEVIQADVGMFNGHALVRSIRTYRIRTSTLLARYDLIKEGA